LTTPEGAPVTSALTWAVNVTLVRGPALFVETASAVRVAAVFSAAAAEPMRPATMPRNTMHQPAVRIPFAMFPSLPTFNRTFILRISALFTLTLRSLFCSIIRGPTKQLAEKGCTGQESNTRGAKARRILNRLRPD
jgi:hypothetical protein